MHQRSADGSTAFHSARDGQRKVIIATSARSNSERQLRTLEIRFIETHNAGSEMATIGLIASILSLVLFVGNSTLGEASAPIDLPHQNQNGTQNESPMERVSLRELVGRQLNHFWDYLINGSPEEPQSTFAGRCLGIGKKLQRIMPILMMGGGVIITKLAFLVLFSLKTLGLLGLLLLVNVGTAAAKFGAFLASKKEHHEPLHVHVQPWKNYEEHYSSSHLKGPPYGWDDKSDVDVQTHELYNLYEKLKMEQSLRRYLVSNARM
ncbi:uncharacterized protein [Euwallacea fornicatus]|uniref:uncharacterized protein n=1 Tax=Euwallacea fornicatus TaxID=995702 RepID=UPI00338FF3C1